MHGRKDSHRDNSAHLRVVEFFCNCVAHQDVLNTHLLLLKTKSKQTNRTNFNNKNGIEITISKFTDLTRFRTMGQLTAFFSLSDEPRGFAFVWFELLVGRKSRTTQPSPCYVYEQSVPVERY